MKLSRQTRQRLFFAAFFLLGAVCLLICGEKLPLRLYGGILLIFLFAFVVLCELVFPKIRKRLAGLDAEMSKEQEQILVSWKNNLRHRAVPKSKFSVKGLFLLLLVLGAIAPFIAGPAIFLIYVAGGGKWGIFEILLVALMSAIIVIFSAVFIFVAATTINAWLRAKDAEE